MCKEKLEEFFSKYNKEISLSSLVSKFKLNENEIGLIIEYLYELELEGKIYKNECGNYIHISNDYYLTRGKLQKSSKNQYYINLSHGKIITIPTKNLNCAKENDDVFVETTKGKKHSKQIIGNVVRIINKSMSKSINTFHKSTIKKDFTKNYFYVELNNNRIYISTADLNGAFINDEVTIQLIDNKYAKVINIVKRESNIHVFEYKKINNSLNWVPINSNFNNYKLDSKVNFEENDRILAKIENNKLSFIKKINNDNSLKSIVYSLLQDFGFRIDFPNCVLNELKNIETKISINEIKKRVDLRNLITFTIDGKSAKDLDDAISLEIDNDEYILYVHIADVSHYVKIKSELFNEACKRGTSIYAANYVVPQFPSLISNIVCSLNPCEDKLTKTIEVHLDKYGEVIDYKIYKSIINSNMKMNYDDVNNILENDIICDSYSKYVNKLKIMNELSNKLINRRKMNGQVILENSELEHIFDEFGNVIETKKRRRGPAELLIESFMLKANEVVGEFANNLIIPFIYRNHEGPNLDQINKMKDEFAEFDRISRKLRNVKNSAVLQRVLTTIFNGLPLEECEYLSKKIFGCMNRAFYSNKNIGHFALSFSTYTTFTSPIRRGPDLINHIVLDYVLDGRIGELNDLFDDLEVLAIHFSEMQKRADKFEKSVEGIILNRIIGELINQKLEGNILFVGGSSVFIKTKNNLYGSIPIKNKMYDLGTVHMDGKIYKVGDNINVMVDHVDERSNEIIFKTENQKVLNLRRKADKND